MLRKALNAVVLIVLLAQAPTAASYAAVAEPELYGARVVVADLYGQGERNLLVGRENGVFIREDHSYKQLLEVSGTVSALAVGDVTGDFRSDLAIGTDRGGALYLYTERGGTWERHGHAQYLWDTISWLGVHDFNGDGWGDLAALTDKGEAFVYLSREGNLFPLWKSPAGEFVVRIEVVDVDQNGYPDLVYALRSGYVAVLAWEEELVTLWENYPWGAVESLVILPHEGSPEWLVVTSQKMLYGWRWHNGEVVSSRKFEAKALGEHLFYIPEQGLLSLSAATGISLFELQSAAVVEKWRVPGLSGEHAFYYDGSFFFRDSTNAYLRLVEGTQAWRFFVYDTEVTDRVGFMHHNGQLYFNLLDLGAVLGFKASFEEDWQASTTAAEVTLWPASTVLGWQGLLVPLANPIVEEGGALYVPGEVLQLLGWTVRIDSLRQQVIFLENWGWWV